MIRRSITLGSAILLFASQAAAQNQVAWSESPVLGSASVATSVLRLDSQDNVIVGGIVGAPNGKDIYVYKYDSTGTFQWARTYNGAGNDDDLLGDLCVGANGDVWVTGTVGLPAERMVLLHYDPNGNLLWSRIDASAPTSSTGGGISLDSAGNVCVVGVSTGSSAEIGFWKYDAAGNLLAQTTSMSSSPFFNAMSASPGPLRDSSSNLIACVFGHVFGGFVYSVVKFDTVGNVLWWRFGPGTCVVDSADNVYGGAPFIGIPGSHPSGVLWKYDPAGTLLWSRDIVPVGLIASTQKLCLDARGDLVLVGMLRPTPDVNGDGLLRKYDPAGNVLWSRAFSDTPSTQQVVNGVALVNGMDIVTTGMTVQQNSLDEIVQRFDMDGDLKWVERVPSFPTDIGDAVASNASGSVFLQSHKTSLTFFPATTRRLESASVSACFGDGSQTACPCGNSSGPFDRAGCTHALGIGGRLHETGIPTLTQDTLQLHGTGMPDGSVMYFQGSSAGGGVLFGDGLLCVAGTYVRLGVQFNAAGASVWPPVVGPPLSTQLGAGAPVTVHYQAWYRDAQAFCSASTFNLTNMVSVLWTM